MKKKIVLLSVCTLVATGAIALSALSLSKQSSVVRTRSQDEDFTLTINGGDFTHITAMEDAHGDVELVTDSTKEAAAANQNKVKFGFEYCPYNESTGLNYLTQNLGKAWNVKSSPIRSMKRIDIKGSGSVLLQWGWLDETNEIKYYDSENLNIGGDGDYSTFRGYTPNYFKLVATNLATVGLERIVITYDKRCVLAENPNIVYGGLKYRFYGSDGLALLGFSGDSFADVVIPGEINGRTVQVIGEDAFCNDTVIESVYIPNTVEDIRTCAFDGCSNLETLEFEMGGTEQLIIGQTPFRGTAISGTVTIPARAKNAGINSYGFADMFNVTAFEFENNVSDGYYRCADGVLYSDNGRNLLTYPYANTNTSFTVPSTVNKFTEYVGIQNNHLETLTFTTTGSLRLWSGCLGGSSISQITFDPACSLDLYWYPFKNMGSLRQLVLPAATTCRSMCFNAIGTAADKPCNVFVSTNDISSWRTDESGDGAWYRSKAAYCKIYLLSPDAAIPAEDLPDYIDGSWHYVGDVPTVW